jgi:hypothetical protein
MALSAGVSDPMMALSSAGVLAAAIFVSIPNGSAFSGRQ